MMGHKRCVLKPELVCVVLLMLSAIVLAKDESRSNTSQSARPEEVRSKNQGIADIYNPDAYDDAIGFDNTGTYILIKRGTFSYVTEGGTKNETRMQFEMLSREVVRLKMHDSGEIHIYAVCMERDWGGLTRKGRIQMTQHSDSHGRFSGTYAARFASAGGKPSQQEFDLDPLRFGPDEKTGDDLMTNVEANAKFDLVRIADLKSKVGLGSLSYSVAGNSEKLEVVCVHQANLNMNLYLVGYPSPNKGSAIIDVVVARRSQGSNLLSVTEREGDAIVAGQGTWGDGKFSGFDFSFQSGLGRTEYHAVMLEKRGDTGEVDHSVVKNDIGGVEFYGKAIPSGKKGSIFSKKSVPVTYRLDWPLK